jgi:hypothetical protein
MEYKVSAQALAVCVAINYPVLLWGPPGNGKTTVASEIARTYNLHLEVVIASIRDPSDFSGIPYIHEGSAHFIPPRWAHAVVNSEVASVVVYDEISTATPALQAALLRPILERVVGDLELPAATRSIGTANPPSIAADGWELSPPIANRFVHLDWELDAETVKSGFIDGFTVPVMPLFPKEARMAGIRQNSKTLVGIFLGTRPELVSHIPDSFGANARNFAASDYAFPTPRAWETAASLHAACVAGRMPDRSPLHPGVLPALLRGTVGVAAATEFLSFVEHLDLPNPNELLDGTAAMPTFTRGDQIEAVMSSINYAYDRNPTNERWVRYGDILSHFVNDGRADAVYRYIALWNSVRPHGATPTGRHVTALSNILDELES